MNSKLNSFKEMIKGKKVAVMGVGISNRPLIRYIYSLGADITAFDALEADDVVLSKTMANFKAEGININWSVGKDYMNGLKETDFDYIFRTPKMRNDKPELVDAVQRGAVLTSEMEVFMALCPAKIFAVTGSDGKTTTTTLISKMLIEAGYKVYVGGNIGTPLLDKIDEVKEDDMVVLELSSFQLLTMAKSADVAVVTNVTPNHLDVHKSYDEYISVKTNIFRNQDFMGKVVLNGKCDITYDMYKLARGNVSFFAQEKENCLRNGNSSQIGKAYLDGSMLTVEDKGVVTSIIDEKDILIPGKHNVENYLAAISACWGYVSVEQICKVAKTFGGVEHRIELVRELDGVRYYNSSIDTSPNRTINTMNALLSRNEKGVLIAGGADKKCIYDGLGDAILKVCDRIVLCGSNAPLVKAIIEKEANGRSFVIFEYDDYKSALDKARELANPGELVILSPVGTSYDKFRHFEERGNLFKDLVRSLA
ncbi:MAG: UDP-N-acetylmuramoyl-L-alanine--D-glutamate ligase [Clostridia bacterium]|nr:UDP-N-acetylmuramoyl-L-alanine--D-glutamate ligase [Clostridia bacterium]